MRSAFLVTLLAVTPGLFGSSPQQTPQPAQPSRPRPAPTEQHKQFDFWLGEWDVTAGGQKAGTNSITSLEGGFAVKESWTSAGGGTGTSLNFFDRADGKWHQVWIDSGGNALFLAGGLVDGKMVLQSAESNGAFHRVTWTPNPDGTVRQFWESTSDGGKTFTVAFDGLYRKKR